jgi:hypothetical protein
MPSSRSRIQRRAALNAILVANDVSNGKVFGMDSTEVLIVTDQGKVISASGQKSDVAHQLLDVISDML